LSAQHKTFVRRLAQVVKIRNKKLIFAKFQTPPTPPPSCGLYYKSFTIVICDRNDNGLHYKTTIVANLATIVPNLALARSVNYDHKVRCKLKRTFTIVNYDPKPFILQAAGDKAIKKISSSSRMVGRNKLECFDPGKFYN
jgi:hypothetical protein